MNNVAVSGYGQNCVIIHDTGITGSGGGFSNLSVINNVFHDCTGNSGADTAGLVVTSDNVIGSFPNATVTGNLVYNLLGYAAATPVGNGMFLVGFSGSWLVSGNTIHDSGSLSITSDGTGCILFFANTGSGSIKQNEVYNCRTSGGDGVGIDLDAGTSNAVVEQNWIHDCDGAGVLLFQFDNGGFPWASNTVRYNVIQNAGVKGAEGGISIGISALTMTGLYVHNNTIYTNGSSTSAITEFSSSASVTATFANNIFYMLSPTPGPFINLVNTTNIKFTGNDYYGTGSFSWEGTSYPNFAAWQTATSQEKISGTNVGQTKEPRLVAYGVGSTTNGYVPSALNMYQLQTGSPMLGGGIDITAQYGIGIGPVDFYGVAITSSSKVIGAGQQVPWSGAASASCADATTLINRLTSPTTAEQQAANATICGGEVDGWWQTRDFYYKLAASSSTNALLNWKSTSFSLTTNGGLTFAAGSGYTGDGTTGFLNTNFTPSTNAVQCTQNSCGYMTYILNSRSDDNYFCESGQGSPTSPLSGANLTGSPTLDTSSVFSINDGGTTTFFGAPNINVQGLWDVERTGATTEAAYQNNVQLASASNTSNGLPTGQFYLVAQNYGGGACFSADTMGYADTGTGLSATNVFYKTWRINTDACTTAGLCL